MAFYLSNDGKQLYEGSVNPGPSTYHEISVGEANEWRENFMANFSPPSPSAPVYDNATLTAALLALTKDL